MTEAVASDMHSKEFSVGLDLVEFMCAIEEVLDLHVPNADAQCITTPGMLVDYLEARVGEGRDPGCLEQRAFYRLRKAGMCILDQPRGAFQPSTPWSDVLQTGHYSEQWRLIGEATGVSPWPRLAPIWKLGKPTQTVGETARGLAAKLPGQFMRDGEGWDRKRIEAVVTTLIAEELGVLQFRWSDRFVQDLDCE